MKLYEPSAKALRLGVDPDSRISVVGDCYLWLRKVGFSYTFESKDFPGSEVDVLEDKSHMKQRPDSMWQEAGDIDVSTVFRQDLISSYNRSTYRDELVSIGL